MVHDSIKPPVWSPVQTGFRQIWQVRGDQTCWLDWVMKCDGDHHHHHSSLWYFCMAYWVIMENRVVDISLWYFCVIWLLQQEHRWGFHLVDFMWNGPLLGKYEFYQCILFQCYSLLGPRGTSENKEGKMGILLECRARQYSEPFWTSSNMVAERSTGWTTQPQATYVQKVTHVIRPVKTYLILLFIWMSCEKIFGGLLWTEACV